MEFPVHVGTSLPDYVRPVTQSDVDRYAQASGDFNPIHIDEAFASATSSQGHDCPRDACPGVYLRDAGARIWRRMGRIRTTRDEVSITGTAGDTLTVTGQIESLNPENDIVLAICSVWCRNEAGEVVVSGEARVRLPARV